MNGIDKINEVQRIMEHNRGYKCPVKEGDIVEAKCEAIGEKGDGICKIDGFVIFVPGIGEGNREAERRVLRRCTVKSAIFIRSIEGLPLGRMMTPISFFS